MGGKRRPPKQSNFLALLAEALSHFGSGGKKE
jgi:hypothetical protein